MVWQEFLVKEVLLGLLDKISRYDFFLTLRFVRKYGVNVEHVSLECEQATQPRISSTATKSADS